MEFKKRPRGNESIKVPGLGYGYICQTVPEKIESIFRMIFDHSINFWCSLQADCQSQSKLPGMDQFAAPLLRSGMN